MIRDESGNQRFFGNYRGVVFDNNDPDKLGRIRVTVPQLFASNATGWAWPKNSSGLSLQPPPVGQGVWVEFEGGDSPFPIWTGTFGKNVTESNNISIVPLSSGNLYEKFLVKNYNIDGTTDINLVESITSIASAIDGGSA
jgi:hypothetical protein